MSRENFIIREASEQDCAHILDLITELAIYEKAEKEVEITSEQLVQDGFRGNPNFHVILAEQNDQVIGMAFYYYKYSTWKGRCLYLEDLVVRAPFRQLGAGSILFETVIKKAHKQGVKRMEWQVLDWNIPAIKFYEKYNAELDAEWINGKFYEKDLNRMMNIINLD